MNPTRRIFTSIAELFGWPLRRTRLERSVLECRERLHRALSIGYDGYWEWSAAAKQKVFVSERWREIVGLPLDREQIEVQDAITMIHPDDRERVIAAIEPVVARNDAGGQCELEHRFRRPDGRVIWVKTRAVVTERDLQGRAARISGVVADITAWKQTEEEIRGLARFPEENPNPVLRVSAAGKLLYANKAAKTFLQNMGGAGGADLPSPFARAVQEITREGRAAAFEIPADSGRVYLFQTSSGSVQGQINIYGADITQRKRAEAALRESVERARLLSENAAQLLRSDNPANLVADICGRVMRRLDCQVFLNFLVEEGRLHLNACSGISSDEARRGEWLDYGAAVRGGVAQGGRRIVAEHVQDSADERLRLIKSYGVKVYASHPLLDLGGEVIGALGFGSRERDVFAESDLAFMQTVADQVAVALGRMRGQQSALDSQRRLAAIVDSIADGFYVLDRQWRFIRINDAALRHFRKTRDELMGRAIWEVFPQIRGGEFEARFRHAMESGDPARVEIRSVIVDAVVEIHAYPGRDNLTVIFRDVTARIRVEEELRQAALERERIIAQLQAILDNMTEGLIVSDMEGRLFHWNSAALAMHGMRDATEYLKRMPEFAKIFELSTAAEGVLPLDRWPLARILRGETLHNLEVEIRRLDRDWRRVFSYGGTLARNPEGKPLLAIVTLADITQRKQNERQLKELNENLEQRVAARTVEVQRQANMLRALTAELSQAERRERRRLAKILHDHIQQLLVAARMQVDWVRRESGSQRLQLLLQGVESILREAITASRTLTVELSPPILHEAGLIAGLNWLVARMADTSQFQARLRAAAAAEPASEETRLLLFDCVRELLFNVLKHSGVMAAEVAVERAGDDEIKITVRDSGRGFDINEVRKHEIGRAGFGLFNIQQRVVYMGGRMEINSAPGQGAAIVLRLPLGQPEIAARSRKAARCSGAAEREKQPLMPGKRITVLLVDDHKIVREGLARLLQTETDLEVVGEAEDGMRAVELTEKLHPRVVIMDVNLKGMSGIEATRAIISNNKDIKVIGLSMHIDSDIAVAMQQAGASAYVTKGGPAEELVSAIRDSVA